MSYLYIIDVNAVFPMLPVDMLAFAVDNCAPATFLMITGDRDFSYAASILRLRGYEVIVVLPSTSSHVSLRKQASILFDWQRDVLGNRSSSHPSNEDASGQQECSSGAVSSEMTTVSPSNVITVGSNIPDAFAPATPTLPYSGQSSSTTLQSLSSDTDENNVDITSSASSLDTSFAGSLPLEANFRSSCDCCGKHTRTSEVGNYCAGEFERDKKINDDDSRTRTRTLLPNLMQKYGSAMQPLQASFGQHTTSCVLVDERPSNKTKVVETESQVRAQVVNDIAMETEGGAHVLVSEQINAGEAGSGGSPHDGDGALRRRSSLSNPAPPPLPSSPRSATLTDTTGFNTTAGLTGMGKPDVLLRETHSDAVIAVLPASRDKEFNSCNNPTPHADSHDVDTSSGEFSGGSCDTPLLPLSLPRPSSPDSQGAISIAKDKTTDAGRDASLIPSVPTTPCGSVSQTTLIPSSAVCSQSVSQTFSLSTRSDSFGESLRTDSPDLALQEVVCFSVLVECFQAKWSLDGTTRIRSSDLGTMLLKREPRVYELAGVHRLTDYIHLACLEGFVTSSTPDRNGNAWVELQPPYLYTPSFSDRVGVVQTHSSRPPSPPISLSPTKERSIAHPVFSLQTANANDVPDPFIPLVSLLRQLSPSAGRVLFSVLGALICQKYPGLYKWVGVSGLRAYLERARALGMVTLGALETQGKQWVQLVYLHSAV